MTIFIRTSGGGAVVLPVVLALIYSHGSGLSGTVGAVLLGLVALVVLAILVTLAVLVRRLLPPREPSGPRTVVQVVPEPGELAAPPRALDAPVRLADDQLERLAAEIIRRSQRPE
jgi:hypothetical protein